MRYVATILSASILTISSTYVCTIEKSPSCSDVLRNTVSLGSSSVQKEEKIISDEYGVFYCDSEDAQILKDGHYGVNFKTIFSPQEEKAFKRKIKTIATLPFYVGRILFHVSCAHIAGATKRIFNKGVTHWEDTGRISEQGDHFVGIEEGGIHSSQAIVHVQKSLHEWQMKAINTALTQTNKMYKKYADHLTPLDPAKMWHYCREGIEKIIDKWKKEHDNCADAQDQSKDEASKRS